MFSGECGRPRLRTSEGVILADSPEDVIAHTEALPPAQASVEGQGYELLKVSFMDVFLMAGVHQQPEQSNYLAEGQS